MTPPPGVLTFGTLVAAIVEVLVLTPLAFVDPSDVPTGVVGTAGIVLPAVVAIAVGRATGVTVALVGSIFLAAVSSDEGWVNLLPAALWPAVAVMLGTVADRVRAAANMRYEEAARDQDRIAAELHDDALQMLVACLLMLEGMRFRLVFPGDPRFRETIAVLRDAIERTRVLIFDLRAQTELGRRASDGRDPPGGQAVRRA
jgi:signal transduction histidine kinase